MNTGTNIAVLYYAVVRGFHILARDAMVAALRRFKMILLLHVCLSSLSFYSIYYTHELLLFFVFYIYTYVYV